MLQKKIDAVYVTRFQKERWTEKERPYPKIDAKFLREAKYSQASVMHPLPRVNELDASLDSDRRAIYFRQAAYGVPVRMALISLLLHLHKNKSLHKFAGGFAKPEYPVYVQPIGTGVHCVNANCITGDPAERQYAANKFYVMEQNSPQRCKLRCLYCETDIEADAAAHFVVGDTTRKTFSPGFAALARAPAEKLKQLVIYGSEADAHAAGFHAREAGKRSAQASPECIPASRQRAEKYGVAMLTRCPLHAALVFGYLCGRSRSAFMLTRLAGGPDIRAIGRAISAPPTSCAPAQGLAAARWSATAQGHCGGPDRRIIFLADLASPRRSALFSAICFRSGSASAAARASRPISVS